MNEEVKKYPTGIETETQKQLYDEHYRDFVETIEGLLRRLFRFKLTVNALLIDGGITVFYGTRHTNILGKTSLGFDESADWEAHVWPSFYDCVERISGSFYLKYGD